MNTITLAPLYSGRKGSKDKREKGKKWGKKEAISSTRRHLEGDRGTANVDKTVVAIVLAAHGLGIAKNNGLAYI
jgi:hypothetical protein